MGIEADEIGGWSTGRKAGAAARRARRTLAREARQLH
jgi:hypothetical protein